jgi:hypothetical protein
MRKRKQLSAIKFNDKESSALMANDFFLCEIVVVQDSVMAFASGAIVKTETGQVVLKLKKHENDVYYFEKSDVEAGRSYNGFTELQNADTSSLMLVKGVYNIVL